VSARAAIGWAKSANRTSNEAAVATPRGKAGFIKEAVDVIFVCMAVVAGESWTFVYRYRIIYAFTQIVKHRQRINEENCPANHPGRCHR
jgi:hypothetical protein